MKYILSLMRKVSYMYQKYSPKNKLLSFSLLECILALLILSIMAWMVVTYEKKGHQAITSIPKQEVLLRADTLLKHMALEYTKTKRLDIPIKEQWGRYEIVWRAIQMPNDVYRLEAHISQNQEPLSSLIVYTVFLKP